MPTHMCAKELRLRFAMVIHTLHACAWFVWFMLAKGPAATIIAAAMSLLFFAFAYYAERDAKRIAGPDA